MPLRAGLEAERPVRAQFCCGWTLRRGDGGLWGRKLTMSHK